MTERHRCHLVVTSLRTLPLIRSPQRTPSAIEPIKLSGMAGWGGWRGWRDRRATPLGTGLGRRAAGSTRSACTPDFAGSPSGRVLVWRGPAGWAEWSPFLDYGPTRRGPGFERPSSPPRSAGRSGAGCRARELHDSRGASPGRLRHGRGIRLHHCQGQGGRAWPGSCRRPGPGRGRTACPGPDWPGTSRCQRRMGRGHRPERRSASSPASILSTSSSRAHTSRNWRSSGGNLPKAASMC